MNYAKLFISVLQTFCLLYLWLSVWWYVPAFLGLGKTVAAQVISMILLVMVGIGNGILQFTKKDKSTYYKNPLWLESALLLFLGLSWLLGLQSNYAGLCLGLAFLLSCLSVIWHIKSFSKQKRTELDADFF